MIYAKYGAFWCRYFLNVRLRKRCTSHWGIMMTRDVGSSIPNLLPEIPEIWQNVTMSLFVSVSPPGFGRIIDELSLEVATLIFLRLSLTEMRITLHRSLRDWKDHVVSMCADICLVHGVPVYKLSQLHCSTVWQKRHSRLEVCNPLCVFIFLGYTRGSVNIFFGILF